MNILKGTNVKLSKDVNIVDVNPSLFTSMIDSLLYLTISHLDIHFSIGVRAQYQANPKESPLSVLKRIISYVNVTCNFGIWYTKDTNFSLVGFSNINWAKSAND